MDFAKYFQVLAAVPQLSALVQNAVVEFEAVPGLSGSQKLAAVVAKVQSILSALGKDVAALAELRDVIVLLANASVAAFNAAKLFKSNSGPKAG